jgi:hypothetical protein
MPDSINASKLIMRPEVVVESHLCLALTDCRYDGARLRETGEVPENGPPHPQAGVRNLCTDDSVS